MRAEADNRLPLQYGVEKLGWRKIYHAVKTSMTLRPTHHLACLQDQRDTSPVPLHELGPVTHQPTRNGYATCARLARLVGAHHLVSQPHLSTKPVHSVSGEGSAPRGLILLRTY